MKKIAVFILLVIFSCSLIMGSSEAAKKKAKKAETVKPKAAIKLEDVKITVIEEKSLKYWTAKAGLASGGALLAATYNIPFKGIYVGGEAGYVIGSGFGVMDIGINCLYPLGDKYLGVEATYANYSKTVGNIPGISGNKNGAQTGFGIIAGMPVRDFILNAGYNTALGIRLDLSRQFYL